MQTLAECHVQLPSRSASGIATGLAVGTAVVCSCQTCMLGSDCNSSDIWLPSHPHSVMTRAKDMSLVSYCSIALLKSGVCVQEDSGSQTFHQASRQMT